MKKSQSKTRSQAKKKPAKAFFPSKAEGHFFSEKNDVQTKLRVGKANDKYEREADQVADQVVDKGVQGKAIQEPITPLVRNHEAAQKMAEEAAMTMEEEQTMPEEPVQKQEEAQEMAVDDKPQAKEEEGEAMMKGEEPVQQQEEAQQTAAEEPAQKKSEEGEAMMMGEETGQKKEEAEQKEDEVITKTEEPLQKQEEAHKMPAEENGQTKAEEEPLQTQEDVQQMGDEETAQKEEEEAPLQKQEETQEKGEEPYAQSKEDEGMQNQEEETAQGKGILGGTKGQVEKLLKASKGKGSPLPEGTRQEMERGFGADFSQVRIHTGGAAVLMNKMLGAQAFAVGKDIFFNTGKYDVNSKKGQQLLAHELTHSVQQGAVDIDQAEGGPDLEASDPGLTTSENSKAVPPASSGGGEAPQKPEQPEKEEAVPAQEGELLVEGEMPEGELPKKRPMSPEEDPNFQALKERSETSADQQKAHRPSKSLAKNAGDAAPSPDNEPTSQAQDSQVDDMDRQEPKEFDAESFKNMLLDEIKKVLPENEEEADDFAENNEMDQVKDAASNKVESEKTNAAGDIQQATDKEPETSRFPKRQEVPLKTPKPGGKPGSLEANKAMPPARPHSEVNQPLEDNAKEVDDEMANNNVTEEQLAKSEEPKFIGALDSKKTAQEDSKSAPGKFREKEKGTLETAQGESEAASQDTLLAIHGDRKNVFNKVGSQQGNTSKSNTSERDRVAKEIDGIYQKAKKDVESILTGLDTYVEERFTAANDRARKRFEDYVEREMDAYKDRRYGSWYNPVGLVKRGYDALAGLPDEVNKFFVAGRQKYIDYMDVELTAMARHIANELNRAKKRIELGRKEVKDYVKKLPKNLKKFGEEAASEIQDKFSDLQDSVNDKQGELVETIAQKYKESLEAVDARIEEMKAANRGLIDKAIDAVKGVIETIKKLKEMIQNLMSAIASVISVIIADPIGFMKDLFSGIGQGIKNFMANVMKHLLGGLFKWLTGAMGPMGITIPDNIFSLAGIFNLVMQILGLGWEFIRRKAVKLLGEKAVAALEKGFEMFKLFREKGVDGIWQHLKEKFTDLKETVIGAIKNMLITKVIEAGIKWVLSLLIPGAGFVKAIFAIKDLIVFFVETAIMLIPALTNAIKAAASRNMSMIAKAIETGIALLIPIVINLLAKLIGIGGLAKKVQKIIKKIRKRIDRAVNKLIMKAKKWVKKLWKKGKEKVKKVAKAIARLINWRGKKKDFRDSKGQSHKMYFKGKGESTKLMVASTNPLNLDKFFVEKKKEANEGKVSFKIADVTGVESYYKSPVLVTQKKLINIDKKATSAQKKAKPTNDNKQEVIKLEKQISTLIRKIKEKKLFGATAEDYPPPKLPVMVDNKKASSFTADYVTKGKKYKVKTGTPSGKHIGNLEGWPPLQGAKLTGGAKWVRMHLLPHKLGGDAVDSNLTPARGPQSNIPFSSAVEQPAIKAAVEGSIDQNKPIWYRFRIKYHSGKSSAFPKSLKAEWGFYKHENGGFKKGPAEKVKQHSTAKPEFTPVLPNLNAPKDQFSVGDIVSASSVDHGFVALLLKVRKENQGSLGLTSGAVKFKMRKKYVTKDESGKETYRYGVKDFDNRLNLVISAIENSRIVLK